MPKKSASKFLGSNTTHLQEVGNNYFSHKIGQTDMFYITYIYIYVIIMDVKCLSVTNVI